MARWPQSPANEPTNAPLSALDAAQAYLRLGWQPVPAPARAKGPILASWQKLRTTAEQLPAFFPPAAHGADGLNVGVLLGEPSAGLVDVDLDWRVAAIVGAHLLPPTGALFGRAGKPRSHYLYRCTEPTIPKPAQFRAPAAATAAAREDRDMVVEVRSTGQQTIFPPSLHECGERICWSGDGPSSWSTPPMPAVVDAATLRRAAELVAAAALLVPHWKQGQRNALQMALAGTLLRAGWTADQAKRFIGAVAAAGGDADTRTQEKTALVVALSAKKLAGDGEVCGWPTLASLVDEEHTMRRLGAWMRLPAPAPAGGAGPDHLATRSAEAEGRYQGQTTPGARKNGNGHSESADGTDAVQGRGVWVRLSTVVPEQVDWVWAARIPKGKLTLIGGDPGVGKSFLLLAILTHVTRGWTWPDGQPCPGPADCVLLCGEDGLADTVRPRVDALGGDPARVWPFKGMTMDDGSVRSPSLASALDVAEIERKIEETGAQLVLVDPINTYLDPKMDTFKGPPVRAITTPLAGLAERTGVAVVLVCHLTKATLQQALYRMPGSVDFVAAARSVLAVGYDPQSEDGRRLLLPVKNNLSAHAPGLGFNIVDGALRWDKDAVEVNAAAMLGGTAQSGHEGNGHDPAGQPGPGRPAKLAGVADVLRLMLRSGPVRSTAIIDAFRDVQISERTVNRARKELGMAVEALKLGKGDDQAWYWRLRHAESDPDRGTLNDEGIQASGDTGTLDLAPLTLEGNEAPMFSKGSESVHRAGQNGQDIEQNQECQNQECQMGAAVDGGRESAVDDGEDWPF